MKTRTLFIFNLLATLFYLGTYQLLPEIINNIVLFLIIILFFYTSEKIKILNNNTYSMSRMFIALSCITLIGTIFSQDTNNFFFSLLFLVVVLIIEAYELLIKTDKNTIPE